MAAFAHLNPEGSRVSDGVYGVYYGGHTLATAIEETRYHRARFLALTREDSLEIDMRTWMARKLRSCTRRSYTQNIDCGWKPQAPDRSGALVSMRDRQPVIAVKE